MAVKMFEKDLSRSEMIKSLEGAMSLAGVLWSIFKSDSADLEANREGMSIIANEIEGRICDVLESLNQEEAQNEQDA